MPRGIALCSTAPAGARPGRRRPAAEHDTAAANGPRQPRRRGGRAQFRLIALVGELAGSASSKRVAAVATCCVARRPRRGGHGRASTTRRRRRRRSRLRGRCGGRGRTSRRRVRAAKAAASSPGRTVVAAQRPCLRRLNLDRPLPSGVFGPRDLRPFSRLAARAAPTAPVSVPGRVRRSRVRGLRLGLPSSDALLNELRDRGPSASATSQSLVIVNIVGSERAISSTRARMIGKPFPDARSGSSAAGAGSRFRRARRADRTSTRRLSHPHRRAGRTALRSSSAESKAGKAVTPSGSVTMGGKRTQGTSKSPTRTTWRGEDLDVGGRNRRER